MSHRSLALRHRNYLGMVPLQHLTDPEPVDPTLINRDLLGLFMISAAMCWIL